MKRVKITIIRKAYYQDLSERYEKNRTHSCPYSEGDEWISLDGAMPEGFCASAWSNLQPYVLSLSSGGGYFFDDWMQNPYSAVISCNDGIRPASFLLETMEDGGDK